MTDYRVNLEIYNGPIDLLLYLIRREEVDIYDIPIARITEQYIQHIELLKQLDPNLAGEFLVMAATLMEIKTRMLLPSVEGDQQEDQSMELDPRAELVRQLMEYKAFKDAAGDLREAHELRSQRFARQRAAELSDRKEIDLEEAEVWDLFDAFSNVLKAIGAGPGLQHIIQDDTPLELYATDIMDMLTREGAMAFEKIFEARQSRPELIGLFLALLELVRQKRVLAVQDGNFEAICIRVNPDSSEVDEQVDPRQEAGDEQAEPTAPLPAEDQDRDVSQQQATGEDGRPEAEDSADGD